MCNEGSEAPVFGVLLSPHCLKIGVVEREHKAKVG